MRLVEGGKREGDLRLESERLYVHFDIKLYFGKTDMRKNTNMRASQFSMKVRGELSARKLFPSLLVTQNKTATFLPLMQAHGTA